MQLIEKRKWFYVFSSILIVAGILSMFIQGFNWGIDFTGGSLLRYKMDTSISADQVRNTVNDLNIAKEVTVQKSGSEFYIRSNELDQKQTSQMTAGLKEKFNSVTLESAESVGATIGSELARNALIAISIALVLMLIYITFRFEWTFGLAAILALFHDVLIVVGLFSIFQWEINSAFIAAILTIIGYSINDTIVIYDRIRENKGIMGDKVSTEVLVDTSITQSMSRSINTSLAVFVSITIVYIFAQIYNIETIKDFALPMMFGTVSGCYSTICIAGPLWTMWKNHEAKARLKKA